MKRLVRNTRLTTRLQTALMLLAGCSFQKFDYLQEGGAGTSSTAGVSNVAGSGNHSGGSDNTPQGGQGEPGGAGKAGSTSHAGKGGQTVADAGDGNTPIGEGGAGGAAGAPNGGTGAVGELVNPSFESGNVSGWQVEPAEALTKKYAFVQWPQGAGSVPDGTYEFSTWHKTDTFTVELHQTIKGLADGTYTFKGYFSRGALNAASMFARNCGGVDPEPVPVPLTDPSQWLAVSLSGIEVSGGSCEVGLHIESTAENWLNADLFSFEKEPE